MNFNNKELRKNKGYGCIDSKIILHAHPGGGA